MSEKLFRFLLSELETIRVKCVGCEATVEIRTDQILAMLSQGQCKVCGKPLVPGAGTNAFEHLARAIATFKAQSAAFQIEFTLPDKS